MHMTDQKQDRLKRDQKRQDARSLGILVLALVIYLLSDTIVNSLF